MAGSQPTTQWDVLSREEFEQRWQRIRDAHSRDDPTEDDATNLRDRRRIIMILLQLLEEEDTRNQQQTRVSIGELLQTCLCPDLQDLIDVKLPLSPSNAQLFDQHILNNAPARGGGFYRLQSLFCDIFTPGMELSITDYKLPPFYDKEHLGKGTYAEVTKVACVRDGRVYARKAFNRDDRSDKDMKKELDNLKQLGKHHHVVRYMGSYTYCGEYCILLAPAASHKDLKNYLTSGRRDPEKDVLFKSFGCLSTGLAFLSSKTRHKDIKPENILVDGRKVYFSDFGSAYNFLQGGAGPITSNTNPGAINVMYAAPEALKTNGQRNTRTDMFSLGCVFAEIIARLAGKKTIELHQKVKFEDGVQYGKKVSQMHEWLGRVSLSHPDLSMPIEWCKAMTCSRRDQRPRIWSLVHRMKNDCRNKGSGELGRYFCAQCVAESPERRTLHTMVVEDAKLVLEGTQGDGINEKDDYGLTALSVAAARGDLAMVKLLLDYRANIHEEDTNEGGQPLHWAALGGNEEVVKLLIEHNADVECQDEFGSLPLAWAAQEGQANIVGVLLEGSEARDSVVANYDMAGVTALHHAAQNGHLSIVEMLHEHGANIFAADEARKTALDLAKQNGHNAVVSALEEWIRKKPNTDTQGSDKEKISVITRNLSTVSLKSRSPRKVTFGPDVHVNGHGHRGEKGHG